MRRRSLTVVVCAVLTALTFILGWIPYGGPFLLPMLFAACCFSLGVSFFSSTLFGLVSLLLCVMSPTSFIGWFFVSNPWVPILARMFIGPIIYFLHKGLLRVIKPKNTFCRVIPISLSAAAGSFLNTLFVGIFLLTLPKNGMPEGMVALGITELVIFGSIEIAVNAILLPPIVMGVKKAMPRLINEVNRKNNNKTDNKKSVIITGEQE